MKELSGAHFGRPFLIVKSENETDNRLIRYLIVLPNGVDVTNHKVLKEYFEVLKKININCQSSIFMHDLLA